MEKLPTARVMFETGERHPLRPEDRTITFFLNRACPRSCYQCGIADNSRTSMSPSDWCRAIDNLIETFGATFFLCLGTEPLLLKDGFVQIVSHLKRRGVEAAWYTTSPEPMFSKYRDHLLNAGIDNWSSGIDWLPQWGPLDPETDKKIKDSLAGLQYMAEVGGIRTHVQTTIHAKNLTRIPELAAFVFRLIPNVEYAINFVEWRKDHTFDFFSPPEQMGDMLWKGNFSEREAVREIMQQVWEVAKYWTSRGRRFYNHLGYLQNAHKHYDKLDVHCQGQIGPSVDADGTMRLCGYNTGTEVNKINVLDLSPERRGEFMNAWTTDLWKCSGCHWSCFRLPEEVR